jgi:hypothetical protein
MKTAGDSARRAAPTVPGTAARARECPRCGARFECGANAGSCWCASLPPLARLPAAPPGDCLCETCLREELSRC